MARPRKKRKYTKRAAYWGADVAKGRGATVAKRKTVAVATKPRGRPPKNGNGELHWTQAKAPPPTEQWLCYVENRAEYYGPFPNVAGLATWATRQYGTGWSLCKLEPVPAPN